MKLLKWVAFLWAAAAGMAAADPMEICRANNPQYPQSCGCTIETARAQGIDGPVLDKLLANDTAGVPMATFQAYGLIFVQCIQQVVMQGVPGAAPAAPAAPPVVAAPAAPAPGLPVIPLPEVPADAPAAGTWSNGALALMYGGRIETAEVTGAEGRTLYAMCHPGGGLHVLVDGISAGPGTAYEGTFEVTRGNGASLYKRIPYVYFIEGDKLRTDLDQSGVDALQAGAEVLFESPEHGLSARFTLKGSSKALDALDCPARPYPAPPLVFYQTGDWTVWPAEPSAGGMLGGIDTASLGELGVACDGFVWSGEYRGTDPSQPYESVWTFDDDPAERFRLVFGFNRGSAVLWQDGLEADLAKLWETMWRAERLQVWDSARSYGNRQVYDLSKLPEVLQRIGCDQPEARGDRKVATGWHAAEGKLMNGESFPVVETALPGGRTLQVSCYFGNEMRLSYGPVARPEAMVAPVAFSAGAGEVELPGRYQEHDGRIDIPGATSLQPLLAGGPLTVSAPAFGLEAEIAMDGAGIAALGCQPAPDPVVVSDGGEVFYDGVIEPRWAVEVDVPGLGPVAGEAGAGPADWLAHVGCGGFAFGAGVFHTPEEEVQVQVSLDANTYPLGVVTFRRAGDWYVAEAPELVAHLLEARIAGFEALPPARLSQTLALNGLPAVLGGCAR
ncbi:hypothetical protein [Pseudoruegeria sp. HB172150]|uniref:hypothetical protein n=1 Tax=Pseudoruegeria sp. HB172150 TaxID=2721164 RepID=UPI0015566CED|nr:hypothetical protein [Pseudoruegeria sp. HB172150]